MISELKKDVNDLTRSVNSEKERAVKLESHSRRNNLIFYGIPEETNESSAKSESLLYSFLEENLKMEEEDIDGISVEGAHRLGKRNANGDKPRPIIAKFTFHKLRIKSSYYQTPVFLPDQTLESRKTFLER